MGEEGEGGEEGEEGEEGERGVGMVTRKSALSIHRRPSNTH